MRHDLFMSLLRLVYKDKIFKVLKVFLDSHDVKMLYLAGGRMDLDSRMNVL